MKIAHVGYVLSESEFTATKGGDPSFLLSVFSDSVNIWLMALTAIIVIGGLVVFSRSTFGRRVLVGVQSHAKDYAMLYPWIARLSLGIAFIGAGSAHTLLTPAFETNEVLSFVQLVVGFCLLAGLATFPAVLVAIGIFLYALTQDLYFLGNLDYLALMFVLLVWGSTRPGVDHLFGIGIPKIFPAGKAYALLVLRVAIGVGMAYLALVEKFLNPRAMEMVIQTFDLMNVVPVTSAMWVFGTGVIELLIAACLFLGFQTRFAAGAAALVLTLSFFFFGEEVYSHVTLFGVMSILFVAGAGAWSLDAWIEKRAR